jgi:hypothetical protein
MIARLSPSFETALRASFRMRTGYGLGDASSPDGAAKDSNFKQHNDTRFRVVITSASAAIHFAA